MILLLFSVIGDCRSRRTQTGLALRMKISDCVSDSRSWTQNKGAEGEERSDQSGECGPEYPDLDIIREE